MATPYEQKQELRRTVAGIRARTPKRTGPYYDEPSENERRLRGVAKRTPKRTMLMDEAYAKETPPKSASTQRKTSTTGTASTGKRGTAGKKSVPAMQNVDAPRQLPKREPPSRASGGGDSGEFNTKLHAAVGKAGSGETEAAKTAPAKTPERVAAKKPVKKKSRLRRAVGAVGRGVRAVGRGVRRVVTGKRRKKQTEKRTS